MPKIEGYEYVLFEHDKQKKFRTFQGKHLTLNTMHRLKAHQNQIGRAHV